MSILKESSALMSEVYTKVPDVKRQLLRAFKAKIQIVDAWRRSKPSNDNPNFTGKGNPIDRVDKLIDTIHCSAPELAREIAERFVVRVDELDRQSGVMRSANAASLQTAIKNVIEAHANLSKVTINGLEGMEKLNDVLLKALDLKCALMNLEGCIKGVLLQEFKKFRGGAVHQNLRMLVHAGHENR